MTKVQSEIVKIIVVLLVGVAVTTGAYFLNLYVPFFKDNGYFNFDSLVTMYMVGGASGALYEWLLYLIRDHQLVCTNGSLFTPFNFVYGFGSVAVIGALNWIENPFLVFLAGIAVGGVVEYVINLIEEKLFGSRSWNYKGVPFNINGRTCLSALAMWGALAVFVLCLAYRPIAYLLAMCDQETLHIVITVFFAFIVADMLVSYPMFARFVYRMNHRNASRGAWKTIDEIFNDRFMAKRFPKTKITTADGTSTVIEFLERKRKRKEKKTVTNGATEQDND